MGEIKKALSKVLVGIGLSGLIWTATEQINKNSQFQRELETLQNQTTLAQDLDRKLSLNWQRLMESHTLRPDIEEFYLARPEEYPEILRAGNYQALLKDYRLLSNRPGVPQETRNMLNKAKQTYQEYISLHRTYLVCLASLLTGIALMGSNSYKDR